MVGAKEACSGGGCWVRAGRRGQGGLSEREGDGERLSEGGDAALKRNLACGATRVGFSSKRK